jgi:AcrR family transcriptional regulator
MQQRRSRPVSGAALLRPEVTEAIHQAVVDELKTRGYGRVTVDAVARRAGVSKAALYRRWPTKDRLVLDVVTRLSVPPAAPEDTGSLRTDLIALLRSFYEWLTDGDVGQVLADLTAEAGRNPELATSIAQRIGEPRRALASVVITRAVERRELPETIDIDMALDLIGGPLYWRVIVRGVQLDEDYLGRLVTAIAAALRGS